MIRRDAVKGVMKGVRDDYWSVGGAVGARGVGNGLEHSFGQS